MLILEILNGLITQIYLITVTVYTVLFILPVSLMKIGYLICKFYFILGVKSKMTYILLRPIWYLGIIIFEIGSVLWSLFFEQALWSLQEERSTDNEIEG